MKQFLTDPYLLSLYPAREMYVLWIQSNPAPGFIEYGPTEQLGHVLLTECHFIQGLYLPPDLLGYRETPEENVAYPVWQHIGKIEGLTPGERVYYRIGSEGTFSSLFSFHAAPEPGESFRFAQISDLQGMMPCDESVYQIGKNDLDFILYSGDAVFFSWRADQWFDLNEEWQSRQAAKRAFFPCMQQQNGAKLMQYMPTFLCPGNHEVDDMRYGTDKAFSLIDENWKWSIYMQLFRPLYPEQDYSSQGKRWYSVDYGDLHIISLSINRWACWGAHEHPGWRLFDPIDPDSAQFTWLQKDLNACKKKFKWVIQHFHILNKGDDVQDYLCQPRILPDGSINYPDDYGKTLMELFSKGGVNAVSFGHSHVYERYFFQGVHYIEAAYLGVCYRANDAPYHPSGALPIVEDNTRQAFLIVEKNRNGLLGKGYYVNESPELFDTYQIADQNGYAVAPATQDQEGKNE